MALPSPSTVSIRPSHRRRPLSRVVAVTAAAAAVVAVAGCDVAGRSVLSFSDVEKVKITEVVIGPGGSGDVTVRTADIAEVRINRTVRYRGDEPGRTYVLKGTVLHASSDCGDHCSVSYDIEAPTGVTVRGEQGSGDLTLSNVGSADVQVGSGEVTLTGSAGAIAARTGSGDITATDLHGAVTLRTGSGNIEASRLGGGTVSVQTGSGNVDLALDRAANVRAQTGSGNVTLAVPQDTYRVRAASRSGDREIGVTDDPKGRYLLELNAGSGNVSVSAR